MNSITYITSSLVVLTIILQIVLSAPGYRLKRADDDSLDFDSDLNPVELEEVSGDGLDREKRKLPEATFAAKNAILGFVFGASRTSASGLSNSSKPKSASSSSEPVDIPEFDRNKVTLDIPDELFSNSITQVTNISKIFGNFLMNSARRYAQFVHIFQPLFGDNLTIKGENPPKTTTPSDEDDF